MGQNDLKKIEDLKQEYDAIQMSDEQLVEMKKKMLKAKKEKQMRRKNSWMKYMVATAAAVAVFIALPNTSVEVAKAMERIPVLGNLVGVVTFRDYTYESDRHMADVNVSELTVGETEVDMADDTTNVINANTVAQETAKKTAEEINAEIEAITEQMIAEFEEGLAYEEGYQDIIVKDEVIATTEDYFTLKLICYQGAGSGAQWNYYYTIDLNTGERVKLADLFAEGADYIALISENIKAQMREQMKADENVMYWVDYEEVPEWNFEAVTEETEFYLNEDGQIVISFDEGEVAPMYMGCVEFTIPAEVTEGLR